MYSRRRSYSRSRRRSIPRKYLRAYGAQRSLRRLYPSSKFGFVAIPRSEETRARYGLSYRKATPDQRAARAQARYYGRGGYWSKAWRNIIKPIGRAALTGGLSAAKGLLGSGMYTGHGMYTGQGEYETNDLIQGGDSSVAQVSSAADETGAITLSKKEYITDIFANPTTSNFTVQSFSLNPGLEATFPWLAQIAQNYEEYEFTQLIFTYRSTVQDINSANGQVGSVIAATNYNPSAPPFQDKNAMMTYAHSASAKSTDDLIHGVECDPTKLSGAEGKYVRARPVVQGEDLKTYDHGTFQIGVSNTPSSMANQSIGELWVSYTLVLRKPKFFVGRSLGIQQYLAVMPYTAQVQAVAKTGQCFLSSAMLTAQQNNLPCEIQSSPTTANTLTINGAAANMVIRIPASFAGALKVVIRCEFAFACTVAASTPTIAVFNVPLVTGQVRYREDTYAAGLLSGGGVVNPTWIVQNTVRSNLLVGSEAHYAILEVHLDVQPAAQGLDNAIFWNAALPLLLYTQGTGGTVVHEIRQVAIDISEYNAGFAQSNSVPAPLFVNSLGQVTAVQ